ASGRSLGSGGYLSAGTGVCGAGTEGAVGGGVAAAAADEAALAWATFSDSALRASRPLSKSLPIIASMSPRTLIALSMKLLVPLIAQLAGVPAPSGLKVNSTGFTAAQGLVNSRRMPIFSGGRLSVMRMLPSPTFLSPAQA